MKTLGIIFLCIVAVLVIVLPIYFSCTPSGVATWNSWFHKVQEADDNTNYETLKKVEDTCRSMISSYEADKLTYEQYKDSANAEEVGWANQAKMRANKTASTYNNYILENSYVWENNVPKDIKQNLPYLEQRVSPPSIFYAHLVGSFAFADEPSLEKLCILHNLKPKLCAKLPLAFFPKMWYT